MYLTTRLAANPPFNLSAKSQGPVEEQPRRLKVLNSWKRCLSYGVDPYKPSENLLVPAEALREIIGKNQALIECAEPEMKQLLEIIGENEPCVVLTEAEGVLISSVNVENNYLFMDNTGCALGSRWGEKVAGTNALSLALDEKEACYLSSEEHFVHDGYSWTCFASPIFNFKGEVIGSLGLVYGSEVEANAEIMAQVINTARAVELTYNRKFSRPSDVLDRLARDLSMLVFDAFLIVDEKRKIHFLNSVAADFFGLPSAAGSGRALLDLVPPQNTQFWEPIKKGEKALGKHMHLSSAGAPAGPGRKIMANFMPLREFEQFQKEAEGGRAKVMVLVFRTADQPVRGRPAAFGRQPDLRFKDLIGRSPKFLEAVEQAELVAQTNANVVLTGESGVGKDLFAQCIHGAGGRRFGPYYPLNCASIPRELLSSELFGYEDGAFTGARRGGSPGKLELANGGTLFLDEIGEISTELQVYLLRAIESRDIMRLGGDRVVLVDTRIICATNRNLEKAVADGLFRADLYYRLAVTGIHLPPLRERREDIPLLADHLLAAMSGLMERPHRYTTDFMDRLMSHDYPGNIRELKNALERAVIMSKNGALEARFLPPSFFTEEKIFKPETETGVKADMERQLIQSYLERFRHNKSKTASVLGISRNNLYRKMKLYNLD